LKQVRGQIETAIHSRSSSLDKYKSLQQRRRRMSVVAPISDKGNALDFEERIAVCKKIILVFLNKYFRKFLF
jgi:hypothetical protein